MSARTGLSRAALPAAVLLVAALAWPLRGYVTDDTFIHLQYARHLAGGEGLVFNVGERVYGTTSPLWVLLIADLMAIGVDGLVAARVLGGVALLASLLLWAWLLRRTVSDPLLRALGTVVWAAHAWMSRWSLSGMETPLAAALVIGGLTAFAGRGRGDGNVRLASLLWGAAALARTECGLLVALWAIARVLDHGPVRGARLAVSGLWPGLVLQAGWLLFARLYFGAALPNTLDAKAAGGVGLAYHLEQLARQGVLIGSTDGALLIALIALAVLALRRGGGTAGRPFERLVPVAWLVAVPVLYMLRGVPVLSRYLVPLLPVLAWSTWRAFDRLVAMAPAGEGRGARRVHAAAVAVAVLALAQNLVVWQRVVRPQVTSFSAGMHASLIPWGRWFAEHTPPDAVVAAPDIGALGYYGQRRVVDLAGLVTPPMVGVLRDMPQEEAIARFAFARFARPDYVVDRAPRAWDLQARSPWRAALVPVGADSLPNLGVARPGVAVYSIYRIDWAAYDSLDAVR
jgi:arabinofuranosyltransferase